MTVPEGAGGGKGGGIAGNETSKWLHRCPAKCRNNSDDDSVAIDVVSLFPRLLGSRPRPVSTLSETTRRKTGLTNQRSLLSRPVSDP